MFWASNIALVEDNPYWQEGLEQLEQADTSQLNWAITETSSGLTLIVNGIPLHDAAGAISEAKQLIAEKMHPGPHNVHVVFGLGFGYIALEAAQNSDGYVIIYEPHLPLLKFLLTEVDYQELLSRPNVSLCVTETHLKYVLNWVFQTHGNVDGRLDGLINVGQATLFADEEVVGATQVIEEVLSLQHNYFKMGLNLNPNWQSHTVQNVAYLDKAFPATALTQVFANKPAIILSAGPSLDRYLPELLLWKDHVVTIAVAAALYPLKQAGYIPDFVAVLDYSGSEYQLHHIATEETRFLLGPFAHPLSWTCPAKSRYAVNFSNYGNMSDWCNQGTQHENIAIGSGGTVSIVATGFANIMGCNPIILLGQDLAFHGTQQYAGNIHVELKNGFYTREGSELTPEVRLNTVTIKGQQGETLMTSPDYLQFRDQFIDIAKELLYLRPDLRLYNASIGGADIPVFNLMDLSQIAQAEGWTDSSTLLDKSAIDAHEATQITINNQGFIPLLSDLQQQLDKCLSLATDLQVELRRWKKNIRNRGVSAERSITLDNTQGDFVEALQQHWLIFGYIGQEIWTWQKLFQDEPVSESRIDKEMACIDSIQSLLGEQFYPVVVNACKTIKDQRSTLSVNSG
jgi:hypothetical protein